jgi:superfamily II DNA or RNA helicase
MAERQTKQGTPGAAPRPQVAAEIPEPPRDPVELVAWARAHGVEALLQVPVSLVLAPGLGGYGHQGGAMSVLDAFRGEAVSGRMRQLWGGLQSLGSLLGYLRAAANLRQLEVQRREAHQHLVVAPTHPQFLAFLAWLREARGRLAERTVEPPIGCWRVDGVSFHAEPPLIEYAERGLPPVPPQARVRISLQRWEVAPLSSGAILPRYTENGEEIRALDAAIELVFRPDHPHHEHLVAWLTTPAWRTFLAALDGAAPAARPEAPSVRLAFRLLPSFEVQPLVQKAGARGRWSSGAMADAARLLHDEPCPLDPLEEEILGLLVDRRTSRRDRRTRKLLELLAHHPRVHLAEAPDQAAKIRECTLHLELVPRAEGFAVQAQVEGVPLDGATLDGAADADELFLRDPAAATIRIVAIQAAIRPMLRSLAERQVVFPPGTQDALVERLQRLQGVLSVGLPDTLRGRSVPPELRPVVRLELGDGPGLSLEMMMRPLPGGGLYPPGEGAPQVLGLDGLDRVFAERDPAAERAAARRLLDDIGATAAPVAEKWRVEDDELALDLVTRLEEQSVAGRAAVEWASEHDRLRVLATASPGDLRVRVAKKRDWFGVEGEIEVDGVKVSLAMMLEASRRGSRFVRLDRQRFVALDAALRERLALADDALFEGKQGLEASAMGGPALARALEDAGVFSADKAFLQLRDRIAQAQAAEPEVPADFEGTLRPYQIEGFRWLMRLASWGAGGCLCDEMGLGKTLQALAALVARQKLGPALVIAPTSVGPNWAAEAARFAPTLRPRLYRGPDRAHLLDELRPGDLLITSYDLAARDAEDLARIHFATLVLDEAQALKNAQTRRAQAVRSLDAAFRVALTGTPVENHLGELWSIFRVVAPGLLGSWEQFQARFAGPIERSNNPRRRAALARVVRPFLLRRTKLLVAPELPPRLELTRVIDLSPDERALYEAQRRQTLEGLARLKDDPTSRFVVLAALTRLRRLACHPRLHDEDSRVPSSKLAAFLDLTDELLEGGHRLLVFSQFTGHLALVREALDRRGIDYLYLDGSTPSEQRQRAVQAFQAGEASLFLISLKAGGTGLNLTAADTVVHLDPWWNPAAEDQATDRAHRIGQSRTVTVVRLIARGTIEETVLALHADKRELADSLLEGSDTAARLDTRQLSALVEAGAEALSRAEEDEIEAPES